MATEVGLRVADDWPDGAWMVDLAPIDAPSLIAPAVAAALGVPGRGDDRWVEVLGHLAERQALVIFDNCEGLADDCGRLLEGLLAACPACGALATSRAPLGTPREDLVRLGTLDVGDPAGGPGPAVALFLDRVTAVRHDFSADGTVLPVIADICERLDGLPLALELAAARLAVISPGELLDGLSDRFRLLRSHNPAIPERQRTLEALLLWSDRLLSASEQTCLRRLGVFGASFSIAAATAAVASGDVDAYEIPELVWSLAEKSLVTADLTASATRYRLLESVREFARQRLDEHGETDDTAVRLASWYRDRLGPAHRHQRTWTSDVGLELGNLRSLVPLVASPDPALGQELAFTIARHLDAVGQSLREAIEELGRHIELLGAATPAAVSLHTTLADLYLRSGDASSATRALADAEALVHDVGSLPEWDDAAIERTRGDLACRSGDYAAAFDGATRALAGRLSPAGRARLCSQLGIAALSLGDPATAEVAFGEELEAWRRIGDPVWEASALGNLAEVALRRNAWATAAAHQRSCLTLGLELGTPAMVGMSLIVAARILAVDQRWEEATVLHSQAESILDATGLVLYEADQIQSDVMLERARDILGGAAYGAARQVGHALSLPAAAAEADRVLAAAAER